MEQIYEHKRMMLLTTLFRHISDHSLCEELYSIQEEVTVTKYRPNTKDIYAHTLVGMGFWWYKDITIMNKKTKFEIAVGLFLVLLNSSIVVLAVSLALPIIVPYFFGSLVVCGTVLIVANLYS